MNKISSLDETPRFEYPNRAFHHGNYGGIPMKKALNWLAAVIVLTLCFSQKAMALPVFARMYSYNCSTCHYPGYAELNKFGYNFRAAGYRIPSDIGKDMNDGKFDVTNYLTARFSAGVSAKTTTNANGTPVPDNGSFTLGSPSLYMAGGLSTNFFEYTELNLGNGTGIFPGSSPTLSSAKLGYVTGSENDFFTFRIGKFSAQGFGAADSEPIGTPSISSTVKPTETGIEFGYTHQDTRITLGVYDGIQSDSYTGLDSTTNGTASTTTTLATPASDNNNAKDFQLFVNQFIGDDGVALTAEFYNGFNGAINGDGTATTTSTGSGYNIGQEFYNTAFFISSPVIKNLELRTGVEYGQTGAGIFAANGTGSGATAGGFAELEYELADITPVVFRWDSTTSNVNAANVDTEKYTLGMITPFVQTVYQNPTLTLTQTNTAKGYNNAYAFTDSLYVFF